jgi:opacity protein-like surface antigen
MIGVSLPVGAYAEELERPKKEFDGHASFFLLGTAPKNQGLDWGGEMPNTSIGSGIGAGVKLGFFPKRILEGALGGEAEIFGHGGDVTAPRTTVAGVTRSGTANLATVNSMFNLLLRYPATVIEPYVGVGGGISMGLLTGIDFQRQTASLTGTVSGDAASIALAYQFLLGTRVKVSERFFLFGEYKYFAAGYTWAVESLIGPLLPDISLDFKTHIFSGGIGVRF